MTTPQTNIAASDGQYRHHGPITAAVAPSEFAWGQTNMTTPVVKVTALLQRRPELTHDAFVSAMLEVHAPMAQKIPGLIGYLLTDVTLIRQRADVGSIAVDVDMVADLYFKDMIAWKASLESAAVREWTDHGATIIGGQISLIGNEHNVIAHPA